MVNTPDTDPASSGSLPGTMAAVLQAFLRDNIDDMLPAIVESYDPDTNRARVRPFIKMLSTDGRATARASVASVPVFRFGGGGFFIGLPIKAGDFGWIKANDRDLSLMMQRGPREEIPNTATFHSFQNAMFFPDTFRDWAIDGAFADAMVLQSMTGDSCVAIGSDFVELRAGGQTFRLDATGAKHNGVNIGATHTHGNVENGPDVTGGPQ